MTERVHFEDRLVRGAPPWLQRVVGRATLSAIGKVVDDLVDRTADSVKLRFPNVVGPDSLALIGRDRGIRRGAEEPAATYARRLRRYLDAHRARGSAPEMVRQLHAFFRDSLDPRIDVVAESGHRFWIASGVPDATAAGVITGDEVDWDPLPDFLGTPVELAANAIAGSFEVRPISLAGFVSRYPVHARIFDGSGGSEDIKIVGTETGPDRIVLEGELAASYFAGPAEIRIVHREWAHIWVFLYLDAAPEVVATLVDHAGNTIVTDTGDEIIVVTDISSGGELADEAAEVFKCIPREWKPAHIPYVTVVLLYGNGWVLGYPDPPHVLGEPGLTLGEDTPIYLIAE